MKRTYILLTVVLALAVVATGIFWLRNGEKTDKLISENPKGEQEETNRNNKNDGQDSTLEPSTEYSIRPDFSKVKDFENTLQLQKGVSVKYGDGWTAKRDVGDEFVAGGLFKTVNGRSYMIGFEEKEAELLSANGAYANNLKAYEKILIKDTPHFIAVSSFLSKDSTGEKMNDYAYLSSCSVKTTEACSLPLQSTSNLLFVMLRQNVPNAQYPVELDFTRKDDQQILAEFTEIMSTLQY